MKISPESLAQLQEIYLDKKKKINIEHMKEYFLKLGKADFKSLPDALQSYFNDHKIDSAQTQEAPRSKKVLKNFSPAPKSKSYMNMFNEKATHSQNISQNRNSAGTVNSTKSGQGYKFGKAKAPGINSNHSLKTPNALESNDDQIGRMSNWTENDLR